MAMEIHVFFCGKLPSKAALETAMNELGFPLTIKPATGSLEQQRGFMPMRLGREKTGVEFHLFNGRSAIEDFGAEVDPSFDRMASFRWAGDETEMVCGLCAAAALAKLTNGVVLEEQEGKLLAPDEAVAMARENGEGLIPEAPAGPGSSPPAPPIHVFFRGELPSKAELAAAMKRLSYALILKDCEGSLEDQRGFMPIKLGPQETGVEFHVRNGRSAVTELAEDIDPGLDRVASFHFAARPRESLVALSAAAALAKLTNGIVLREVNNRRHSPDRAIWVATANLSFSGWHETKRPGTRPADIKRYLKPLVELRSDLVLRDRMLIIRPVRHLLRGAFLDRTSDKHAFRVWRYIRPLYEDPRELGYGGHIHDWAWQTWQPHFKPLLMDSLAEDIFESVGKLTTLGDLGRELEGTNRFFTPRVIAFILAGERERAAEYIDEIERRNPMRWQHWAKEQREFLARDINSVCAEYHAKEAETAEALKLGNIWEPAPFGAELPESERTGRSADPLFLPTPWIARPPGLLEEVPQCPGEVRFAKHRIYRNGRIVMFLPLTREEAEERHQNGRRYLLATRLEGGLLLVLDPLPREFELRGASDYVAGSCTDMRAGECATREPFWYWQVDLGDDSKRIRDYRNGRKFNEEILLTSTDRDLATCPKPGFGEFDEIVGRILAVLRNAGYGEISVRVSHSRGTRRGQG